MARVDFAQTNIYNQESDFSFGSDFVFNSGLRLALQNNPGQDFIEDFADDTGHTYDSDVSEFSGGKWQQKNKVDADVTFAATYTTDINGNYGDGVLTGAGVGSPVITGNRLDLTGGTLKYVDYDADLNADSQQVGCVRFKLTPNYNGAPSGIRNFLAISKQPGFNDNGIKIFQSSTLLFIQIADSAGGGIVSNAESWTPVSGTTYEIELNWDITTGATRLFVDGTQLGTTQTDTGTRDGNIGLFRVGADVSATANADFYIEDLVYYSTVQHTTDYTPGGVVSEYRYLDAYDILPEMEYTGAGTLVSFDTLTYTKTGSLKIALQIGRSGVWTYWNGSAWVTGNGTKDYMCTVENFTANVAALDIDGETYGQFKIFLPGSNTQGDIDEMTASLTAQIYSTASPIAETATALNSDELLSFASSITASGSDAIQFIIKRDDDWLYHDGTSWTTSDETYSQSNTSAEVTATFADINNDDENNYYVGIFLHSNDGTTTPVLSSITIKYFTLNFVVEDGTGKTDSTSYATLAQFYQYWIDRGTDYSSTSVVDIKQWLNSATDYIDVSYVYKGSETNDDQALDWPRYYVEKENKRTYYEDDEIPIEIINATCYLAAKVSSGELSPVTSNLRSVSYGPVSKSYSGSSTIKEYPVVDKLLRYLIIQGNELIRVN